MKWDQILGQTELIQNIKNMISTKKFVHASLFAGIKGTGKSIAAKLTAAAIMCNSSKQELPCGQCNSCQLYEKNSHPDFFLIKAEGMSVKIEQIRQLHTEIVFSPKISKQKVVIIDHANLMTLDAANSILKLLEDPPDYLKFILLTDDIQLILPTIVSRCRFFQFVPPNRITIAKSLINIGINTSSAELSARLCGGQIQVAVELAKKDGLIVRDKAVNYLLYIVKQSNNIKEILKIADEIEKSGSIQAITLLRYFTLVLRDLILVKDNKCLSLVYNIDIASGILKEISEFLSIKKLQSSIKIVQQTNNSLMHKANFRMALEVFLLKLTDLIWRK